MTALPETTTVTSTCDSGKQAKVAVRHRPELVDRITVVVDFGRNHRSTHGEPLRGCSCCTISWFQPSDFGQWQTAELTARTERYATMSTDEAVTKDLVETLEDGKEGFAKGAEKLESSGNGNEASVFKRLSEQRSTFSAELRALAQSYGDHADESGSLAGKVHRGWLSLKDALSGSEPDGVLAAAEQGEDHAVSEFDKALNADISDHLRTVVERQAVGVKRGHDEVKALRNAHS